MNRKVPFAILSCFLIAFIVQGALKLGGVFIFEKTLTWDIFRIIDNNIYLNIFYNSALMYIIVYCLSFSFTSMPYSKKWWHYCLIGILCVTTISIKLLTNVSNEMYVIYDLISYILIPFIINLTTSKEYKFNFDSKVVYVVSILAMHGLLYYLYLGLTYWSVLLNSFINITYIYVSASQCLLIRLEVFLGIIFLMLSLNTIIKGGFKMVRPIDVANDEAKEKALQERKEKIEKKKSK